MPKKQKPANKDKAKQIKQIHSTQIGQNTVAAFLDEYETFTPDEIGSFIDNLVKQPLKETISHVIGSLLEYVGIKAGDELFDIQNLTVKQAEYAEQLVMKTGPKPTKELKQKKAFRPFAYRLMRLALGIGKSNKKVKIELVEKLTDWLILLSASKARNVRVKTTQLFIEVLSDLTSERTLLEKAQFRTFFNYIGPRFLVPRLMDIDVGIKQELMKFLLSLIEKADQVFESGKSTENPNLSADLMTEVLLKLRETSFELRRQAAEFILKAILCENVEVVDLMVSVLKTHKNFMLNAIIEASPREIEPYFEIQNALTSYKVVFDQSDSLKLCLLVYHQNKQISSLAAEFWIKAFEIDKVAKEEYDESKFLEFLQFLLKVHEIQGKATMDDFIGLGKKFAPFIDLGSYVSEFFDTFEAIITKSTVIKNKIMMNTAMGLLVGMAIDKNEKSEPFVEQHLNKSFDKFFGSVKTDPVILEGFIQFLRFQLIPDDSPAFKGRITRINEMMEKSNDLPLIKAVYGLYSKHRHQSKVVADQLEANYVTYQAKLRQLYSTNPNELELKNLLYKIRLIVNILVTSKDIYRDFDLVFKILDDAITGDLKCDLSVIIEAGLGIIYQIFYSNFIQLFKIKEDYEAHMARHKDCRLKVIKLLQAFTSFSLDATPIEPSLKPTVRLEAYNLLTSIFLLISKDSIKTLSFVYHYPTETDVSRLRRYIEDLGKAKAKVKLQTEHKRYLREDLEDSNNMNDIEEDKKSLDESLIDEKIDTSDKKQKNETDEQEQTDVKGDFSAYKFICSKTIEMLKNCSIAFMSSLSHVVIVKFFTLEGNKMHYRPILQDYLRDLLVKDAENPQSNSFWTIYYRCLILENPSLDLLNFSRLFGKVYIPVSNNKNLTEEQRNALFINFLNCMLTIFKLILSSKKHVQLIDVLKNVFMRSKFFKDNTSLFKNLLYRFFVSRQEIEKVQTLEPHVVSKLEELESYLGQMAGIYNKETSLDNKKVYKEVAEPVQENPIEIVKEVQAAKGGNKQKKVKARNTDDEYRIKRKNKLKDEINREANETTDFDQRRSVRK